MASQTEAPDDLIAELARLMADETKAQPLTGAQGAQAPTLRIPGDAVPAAPLRPATVAATPAAPVTPVETPRPVRIPGVEPVGATQPPPFRFDFDANVGQKPATGPTSSVADRVAPVQREPVFAAPVSPVPPRREPEIAAPPQDEPAALDGDSLADLIAAELASELAPEVPAMAAEVEVEPVAPVVAPAPAPQREPDNFGVAPIFGVGTTTHVEVETPAPEAVQDAIEEAVVEEIEPSKDPNDPLAQIERLVGPAVHLGQVAGATRSRATPTLPEEPAVTEPASAKPPKPKFDSVDEAILAAAAATGARVEWVNEDTRPAAPAAADRRERRAAARPPFGFSRSVAGPVVAVVLLLVAGGALYWLLGQGGAPAGPAPLIAADAAVVKETPPPVDTAPEQSVVFNEISGVDTGAQEQIVSRDQTDLETVNEVASAGNIAAGGEGGITDPNQAGLVNRKVRTVTVRPDGTIVAGDDSVAGAAMLPVDRPNVPDVPGADFSTPDLIASTSAEAEAATAAAASAPAAAAPAVPVVQAGADVAVIDAAGAPVAGRSVTIPRERPANFQQLAAAALANPPAAPIAPAATPASAGAQAAVPTPASNAAAYVQLSSQRSEEAARTTAQQIVSRFGPIFGGASLEIQRVDLGERGIYYRVLAPADSRATAANICTNVQAAGGDCFVL